MTADAPARVGLRHGRSLLAVFLLCSFTGQAAEITLENRSVADKPVISVRGKLDVGDEKRFLKLALDRDEALVELDGPGGNLRAGVEIGRIIRLKNFDTFAPASCASACALAWLAGTSRYVSARGRVGFHGTSEPSPAGSGSIESRRGNVLMGAYLNSLNLPQAALDYISAAPPESMSWLTTPSTGLRIGMPFRLLDAPLRSERATPLTVGVPAGRCTVDLHLTAPKRAALLVDAPDDPKRVRTYVGVVRWARDMVCADGNETRVARAEIELPDARLRVVLTLQKNTDSGLHASHLIKVEFVPSGPDISGVAAISTPQPRKENTPAGDALIGVPAPVNRNTFFVGLTDVARSRNIDLIRTRGWLDIPLRLSDKRIAKMTFEKGGEGDKILAEALGNLQETSVPDVFRPLEIGNSLAPSAH